MKGNKTLMVDFIVFKVIQGIKIYWFKNGIEMDGLKLKIA